MRARRLYQHGRALLAKQRFAEAREDFERAAGDYRSADIELGQLWPQPSAGMLDVTKAVAAFERAWSKGVTIAAFQLGNLYEHGAASAPDMNRAWTWYRKGAEVTEPNALARMAEQLDAEAFATPDAVRMQTAGLGAFRYYSAAVERAQNEDWPDEAWRNWRYRRASLARIMASGGMTAQVASAYADMLKHSASPAP